MQPLDTFAIIKVSVLCTGESEIVSRVEFRSSGVPELLLLLF